MYILAVRAIAVCSILIPVCASAHNENVHKEITKSAYASSAASTAFLIDYFGVSQDFNFGPPILAQPSPLQDLINGFSPVNWLVEGSYYEDATEYGVLKARQQWRTLDHFFVPWPSSHGLTDDADSPWYALGQLPGGIVDSFIWGTTPGMPGPDVPTATFANTETWQNAREHEYRALTQGSKVSREESLALMLYALGHVLHLNQDTSSPDHTRNDSHLLRAYFENYGVETYLVNANKSPAAHAQAFPLRPRGWNLWRAEGFEKLRDFWERRLYDHSEQALKAALDRDAASAPGMQLGLAEFSNGNFLGEDAVYGEYFFPWQWHYFPFPSRNTSTTYSQIKRQISFGDVAPMDYPDGGVGNRVYLRKIADGIKGGIRHSVLPYLLTMRLNSTPPAVTQTYSEGRPRINDPNVLNDYHSILIPKAIEYSAGILDYFFRGRLDVCMAPGPAAGPHSLTIVNRSGQGFQGGSFKLFWDNANGLRTEIAPPAFNQTYGGSLADGSSISATFTPPSGNVSAYVLVYQGIIGANGTQSLDPVEFDSAEHHHRIETERVTKGF